MLAFLGRGKQGWEDASQKSKLVRDKTLSNFWKWRDETPLKKKKKKRLTEKDEQSTGKYLRVKSKGLVGSLKKQLKTCLGT